MTDAALVARTLSTFLSALLLTACASLPPASLDRETADLRLVRDDALELARSVGAQHVLVVFDIDNTLLAMEQGLGADQWYEWQKGLAAEQPCDPRVVPDRFAVQGAMYFASAMRPTQDDAATIVRDIQDTGIAVIALTSRGTGYRLQTFRELRRNGLDFRRNALEPAAGWPEDFIPGHGSRPARYEDGVFLTAGQHKGDMLGELLERTGTPVPQVVVAVDDKRENLDAIIESFGGNGMTLHTWRYAGEDREVRNFDPDAAHLLWQQLEPGLRTLQEKLGPDNFELPPAAQPGCPE